MKHRMKGCNPAVLAGIVLNDGIEEYGGKDRVKVCGDEVL